MTNPKPALARTQTLVTVVTCRDAHLLFELCRAAGLPCGTTSPEDLQAAMRGGEAFFVAHLDARPVGAIGYRWERGTLRITHVAVKAEARNTGVARRLVQAVEAVGAALGTTNVSAAGGHQALFERFGYRAAESGMRKALVG